MSNLTAASLVEQVLSHPEIELEKVTKSGKTQRFNGRDRLQTLEAIADLAALNLPISVQAEGLALRYSGSCRNDGTLLRPEQLVQMLENVTGQPFQLLQAHRCQLILASAEGQY